MLRDRSRAPAAVVAALALSVMVATTAPPATADPLDDAKARVTEAQEAADAAAARYQEAQTRHAELDAEITRLEQQIEAAEGRAAELREVAEQRAVTAYTSAGGGAGLDAFSDDPMTGARREKLLADATADDNAAVDELARVTDDLEARRDEVAAARRDEEDALAAMDAEAEQLQEELAAAEDAQAAVEEQIRQLDAARQEAERREAERQAQQRATAAAAAAATATATATAGSRSGAPAPLVGGIGTAGGIVCPIRGPVSFVDSWGAPRPQGRHMGVDLMSPHGTPNVAVVSGTVTMRSAGGLPGLGVHLDGDDGNLYYYFHLSSYEGGARRVAQGEVVGYVGNTGDASGGAPHTHFEIHPGGGAAINPYPAVRAACG